LKYEGASLTHFFLIINWFKKFHVENGINQNISTYIYIQKCCFLKFFLKNNSTNNITNVEASKVIWVVGKMVCKKQFWQTNGVLWYLFV
jgi:hypothetical protein